MTIAGETMQGVSRRGGTTVVSQLTRMTDVSTPRQPEVPTIASPVPGPEPVQPKATAVIRILEDPTAFPARPPRPGMIMLAPAVFQDHLVRTEAPDYPAQALQDRIQGVVRLHIEMDRAGKITAVEVISGDTLLGQAVSDAVRKWILRPFAIDGKEQEAYTEIDISFELKE
jgi:protein TonB